MTKRVLLWVMSVALLTGSAVPMWAKPAPRPTPDVAAKAGRITALLPVAKIVHGTGKAAVTNEAKRGDELVWNDLVKTEKGGRARITLADQSILSLGSQAELRIVKHDARAQQTSLQMAYGRVRAQVANITRDGGSFEMRTPTAVAGVIGTDFGVDSSSVGGDTFICLTGAVQVSNSDTSVPGSVQCTAGQTTTVMPGKSPTAPKPASLQQLQQLIADTEPAIISSIVPAAALPGSAFDSTIAGTKMGKVSSVTVAGGTGISASIKSASENSVQIHVVVDATASAGPRTITLTKESGAASATVFTVLGTPIGDPRKAYLDILEQMRSTGEGGLNAFLTGAQQAADQVSEQVSEANQNLPKPLDLTPLANSLNQHYGGLSNEVKGGTDSIEKAAQEAANTFATLYDPAYQALLKRDQQGKPDAQFNEALTGAFTQANAILVAALQNTQNGLNTSVQTYGNDLNTLEQTWLQNINDAFRDQQAGSLPKVNALERIVELGGVASFEVGSSGSAGASISSYQWTLCTQNYHPSGFGQLLPQSAAACNPIQGFTSTNSDFEISTCSLEPGYYYVRLAVTDSDNKISQTDLRLTVLQPNYPKPGDTIRALADAYSSRQLSQFLRWFDGAQFNGYTLLSENIRQTMQSLSSMEINLRVSQENVTCNDATVRADWQQRYSFIGDPQTVYSQTEQLSVRLQRSPGVGWLINDFQGDNGKVQGIPGPQTADTAAPDLVITGTTIDGRALSPGAPLALAAGQHTIELDITNNGTAPLTSGVVLPVVFSIQDSNGNTTTNTSTFNATVPSPLPKGSTTRVTATLNVPTAASNLSLVVQVNPTCQPPETSCGVQHRATYPLELGLPDFSASFTSTTPVNGVVGRQFSWPAVSVTPSPYPSPLTVTYTGLPAGLAAASPVENTTNIDGSLIAGRPTTVGSSSVSATASAAGTTKNVTGSATIVIGNEISFTAGTVPAFTPGGQAQNLTLNITGGIYPLTVTLALPMGFTTTSGTVNGAISTQTLTAPGPVTWSLTASSAAMAGTRLAFQVSAKDAGVPATSTPPGEVGYGAEYSVTGVSNYSISSYFVAGHAQPFTQSNAFQVGESAQLDVTVVNTGNLTSNGTVTVSFDCGNKTVCPTPLTATGAAPAFGSSTILSIPLNFANVPVESFNGSISLTSDVKGATIGGPAAISYDVVDFTIANTGIQGTQNILIGGSANMSVFVRIQHPSGEDFYGIPITPTGDSNIVFTPATQTSGSENNTFPLTVKTSAVPGFGVIHFNATNHGVTKSADVAYILFTINLTSTTLFANDAANPLTVPIAVGAEAPNTYPTVNLRLNGGFDVTNGGASIDIVQPNCGTFSLQTSLDGSLFPGDEFYTRIYAAASNTCPAGTPIIFNAIIPDTVPSLVVPVYTLYVKPSGLPQLSVESATPARDVSSSNAPWLSGEPLDWTVVVRNSGSSPSAGNEKVTFNFNGAVVGQGTVPGPIPAGQTVTLPIHAVAPDYPEDSPLYTNVRITVQHDSFGDLDSNDTGYGAPVYFSNWGINVTSQNGTSDETPLNLNPELTSATATIAVKDRGTFNPNLNLSLVPGSYSSGQLNAPTFSPGTLNSSGASNVTVSYNTAVNPVNGPYFVQVIAQMKDGGTVTAQRQVTIHVQLTGTDTTPAGITLSSDRNNVAPQGQCSECQVIQINGPLPEDFTLTASVSSCSAGNGCPGKADISFTDTFMTVTTPPTSTVQVTSPGNTLPVRVKAADNPDGSINAGPATVKASVSAVQSSFFGIVRTPTPDPVGTVFDMVFNIGDIYVYGPTCVGIAPQDTNPAQLSLYLDAVGGFNVPTVQWEWQDANHTPVGGSPVTFSQTSGSSTYSANGYSPLPTISLQNTSTGTDGAQTYYFAVTVSNGLATATKYFPVDFDLSTSQTLCPVDNRRIRGLRASNVIRGSWGKAGLNAPKVSLNSTRTANGKLPDLRVSASDISFTPSIPKTGDTVAVRFRISNVGDADATGVPIALQVRGITVASDTFDIPAGKAILGGIEWAKAQMPAGSVRQTTDSSESDGKTHGALRAARYKANNGDAPAATAQGGDRLGLFRAQIVIDPQKTITQKSTLAKSAPLAHFGLRDTTADAATISELGEQHALLIQSEGACGGLRFSFGAGTCMASSDLTFTVEDLAKGTYRLEALNGIADLGIGNTSYANASFGMQALLQNGHTYAVQLRGDSVGLLTVKAVRNPSQLSEAAKRLFRQQQAVKIVNVLGGSTSAPETGDTAGTGPQPVVYFDIAFHGQ